METQAPIPNKGGRPVEGDEAKVKKSITVNPGLWRIVEHEASICKKSVSAQWEDIGMDWLRNRADDSVGTLASDEGGDRATIG